MKTKIRQLHNSDKTQDKDETTDEGEKTDKTKARNKYTLSTPLGLGGLPSKKATIS